MLDTSLHIINLMIETKTNEKAKETCDMMKSDLAEEISVLEWEKSLLNESNKNALLSIYTKVEEIYTPYLIKRGIDTSMAVKLEDLPKELLEKLEKAKDDIKNGNTISSEKLFYDLSIKYGLGTETVFDELNPQYITDANGNKTYVVINVKEYEEIIRLLENVEEILLYEKNRHENL